MSSVRQFPYEIASLADHPEAVPGIAAGYEAEWDSWYGSGGTGNARADLRARSRRSGLPMGLVAMQAQEPVGAIAIAANAISLRPELTPVLIGLWVAPAHRRRGIGTALLNAATAKASEMGFARVYVMTTAVPHFFIHAQWRERQKDTHDGEQAWIFETVCGETAPET